MSIKIESTNVTIIGEKCLKTRQYLQLLYIVAWMDTTTIRVRSWNQNEYRVSEACYVCESSWSTMESLRSGRRERRTALNYSQHSAELFTRGQVVFFVSEVCRRCSYISAVMFLLAKHDSFPSTSAMA